MDGNYEWQKFRTNERIEARRVDADMSQMAERGEKARSPFLLVLKIRVIAALSILGKVFYRNRSRSAKRERLV